jgi:hypothetical protein
MRRVTIVTMTLAAVAVMLVAVGCGGKEPLSVSISPGAGQTAPGGTVAFRATVYGETEVSAVTWSASGGTIDENGVWIAPAELGRYTVTVTATPSSPSQESPAKASAKVTVTTAAASPSPSPSESIAYSEDDVEQIFITGNGLAVKPGGRSPTFKLERPRIVVEIMTYHWDQAGGRLGTIALKDKKTGDVYGPWDAFGRPGQGGVKNAYWIVQPNLEIPAGTYLIVDSDPSSWATNADNKGIGMAYVNAIK